MSNSYMRNSHGCIAIYDITSKSSFMMLEQQITEFLNYSGGKILVQSKKQNKLKIGTSSSVLPSDQYIGKSRDAALSKRSIVDNDFSGPPRNVILVGTKLDKVRGKESKRAVLFTDALKLAKKLNLYAAIETSS